MSRFGNNFSGHACACAWRFDRDVADEDAIMNVKKEAWRLGRVRCQLPRRAVTNQKSIVGDVYCYLTDIPWREA